MAVAYESHSIGTWEGNMSGQTLVITKPSGLAVGDLMICHLSAVGDTGDPNTTLWTAPANWTSLIAEHDTATSPKLALDVFYKVADSSDAAATDFTFTKQDNDVGWTNGAIYRISGGVSTSMQSASSLVRGSTTPTYANTLTPIAPNSLFIFLVTAVVNAASGSVASYAIATDNPTWTERYDSFASSDAFGGASYGDGLMSGATATRSQITATGSSSVTLTNFTGSIGAMIIVPPVVNVTGNTALLTPDTVLFAPSGANTVSANIGLLNPNTSTFDISGDIENQRWLDATKGTKTWTNQTR